MPSLLAVAAGPLVVTVVGAVVVAALLTGLLVRRAVSRAHEARLRESLDRLGLTSVEGGDSMVALLERTVRDLRTDAVESAAARSRVQQALDSLPQAVLIVDDSGAVVDRNAAAEVFVEARHADALVEAAVAELVDSALRGEPASRTIDLFGPPRRVVVVTTAPLQSGGRRTAIAVVDDVTERRRLEAVRTDFVANISHELKTPIGAIGLLAETLQAEDDPATTERLAERIQNESLRVGRTIEDLLELSRIELGQVSALEKVDVDDVVLEAVDRIRPAADQAGITVVADDVPDDLVLDGDRRQLISALSNLLDNAVKYSDPGGSVELGAELVGDEIVLSVADHGIGIPSRDIERVFERFYRVDQARSRQTGGTGLGLAIVRHVAANHHGSVEVESRLGDGSRFVLRLPASSPTLHDHPPAPPALTVLIPDGTAVEPTPGDIPDDATSRATSREAQRQ